MSKVSFILPAYKRRFLKESIDSILSQTCRDFELVIVDDKSPEELYGILKEYPWEPMFKKLRDGGKKWEVEGISVRYYQNVENIGGKDLIAAWHHAIEYATGDWCVLASDDDYYFPDYLSEMLRLIEKYPKIDIAHCRIVRIDANGNWLCVGDQRVEYETQVQMAYSRGAKRAFQVAPDFMFRLAALREIGGFVRFPLAWYSDDATWMTLAKNGVACSSDVLFAFRCSGDNITSRQDNIEKKIEAGELFRSWFLEFFGGLNATSREDEFLMRDMLEKVNAKINELSKFELDHVGSFYKWYGLLKKIRLSSVERRAFLYARYPRLFALRMLLPRFR